MIREVMFKIFKNIFALIISVYMLSGCGAKTSGYIHPSQSEPSALIIPVVDKEHKVSFLLPNLSTISINKVNGVELSNFPKTRHEPRRIRPGKTILAIQEMVDGSADLNIISTTITFDAKANEEYIIDSEPVKNGDTIANMKFLIINNDKVIVEEYGKTLYRQNMNITVIPSF